MASFREIFPLWTLAKLNGSEPTWGLLGYMWEEEWGLSPIRANTSFLSTAHPGFGERLAQLAEGRIGRKREHTRVSGFRREDHSKLTGHKVGQMKGEVEENKGPHYGKRLHNNN